MKMKCFHLPDDLDDALARRCPARGQTAFVVAAIRAALAKDGPLPLPPMETLPARKRQRGKYGRVDSFEF